MVLSISPTATPLEIFIYFLGIWAQDYTSDDSAISPEQDTDKSIMAIKTVIFVYIFFFY